MLSREPYPFPDIWHTLSVEPFLKTDRLSATERAMLMGATCAKVYGWTPKKG
jgi:hypothetical protein